MAPNMLGNTLLLADAKEDKIHRPVESNNNESKFESKQSAKNTSSKTDDYKVQIVWLNVTLMVYLHASALYGIFLLFTRAKLATWIFSKNSFFFTLKQPNQKY